MEDGTVSSGWGDPGEEKLHHSGTWLHVPARGRLRVVILSTEPYRYRGHWVGVRMVLCSGRYCAFCERHMGYQTRYAFSVLDAETRACGLLEVGAAAAEAIWRQCQAEGRLRGLVFVLRKEQGRERGTILVTPEASIMSAELLPAAEDVRPHLMRQWSPTTSVVERLELERGGAGR